PGTAPPVTSTLSLHDALPICPAGGFERAVLRAQALDQALDPRLAHGVVELGPVVGDQAHAADHHVVDLPAGRGLFHAVVDRHRLDRKSTRLNSSHEWISYAVF